MSVYHELSKERKVLMERLKDITAQLKAADRAVEVTNFPNTNYSWAINNLLFGKTMALKKRAEWEKKSKALGLTIRNQNQYELACLGANQEIIDTDVPAHIYEIILRSGE